MTTTFRVPEDLDFDLFADLLKSLSDDHYADDALFTGAGFHMNFNSEDVTDYSLEVDFHLTRDSDFEEELVRLVDPDSQNDD